MPAPAIQHAGQLRLWVLPSGREFGSPRLWIIGGVLLSKDACPRIGGNYIDGFAPKSLLGYIARTAEMLRTRLGGTRFGIEMIEIAAPFPFSAWREAKLGWHHPHLANRSDRPIAAHQPHSGCRTERSWCGNR